MTRIKFYLLLTVVLLTQLIANAQELNCRISVNSQQVQSTNKRIFEEMQKSLFEFMNNHRWTNHVYSIDERIECNFVINITQQIGTDEFKGTMQVQSSRPIYGSTYNSVLLNFLDKDIQFKFVEQQPIDFNENSHTTNLASLLAFYSYVILGLDYDSYSQEGGYEFLQKAEKIVNNAQSEPMPGWKAFEDRKNRYWLIENLMNDTYKPIRECLYRYHRMGLDRMSEKQAEGRAEIVEALQLLPAIHRKKPASFIMQVFFDAKKDEILNIFSESFPDEKRRVHTILTEVDPVNASKYGQLLK